MYSNYVIEFYGTYRSNLKISVSQYSKSTEVMETKRWPRPNFAGSFFRSIIFSNFSSIDWRVINSGSCIPQILCIQVRVFWKVLHVPTYTQQTHQVKQKKCSLHNTIYLENSNNKRYWWLESPKIEDFQLIIFVEKISLKMFFIYSRFIALFFNTNSQWKKRLIISSFRQV